MTNLEVPDPWKIANDPELTRDAKIRRLRRLEYDCRQALVASEEGMEGACRPGLGDVRAALATLDPEPDAARHQTKM